MKTEIKSLASLIGGQIISRVEAKQDDKAIGTCKLLIPKAISNGRIDHENVATIDIKVELNEQKLTKAGDIILKLSQPYDAAYITEEDENLLVTSFCLIIREIDSSIHPLYLVSLINSEIYKEQALMLTSGATVPILTKGSIEKIVFDIPSMEEQDKIITLAKDIARKEQLFTEIIMLEKMKLENILRGER